MRDKEIPMIPGRKSAMPIVFGDTPSFLGCPVIGAVEAGEDFDVILAGVPWEGTITWGSFTGCELATRSIRHASARYGGFLPEYEINIFDYLNIGDLGDVPVNPNDPAETMRMVFETADGIYKRRGLPFMFGGDHSYCPEIVRALGENREGRIGVIHFDAHFDNARRFGSDEFPRCGPLHRIAQIGNVRPESIVHIGIRGPRNSPAQMEYAKSIGATVFTMRQVRSLGIEAVVDEALRLAQQGTSHIYVTVCSDITDVAFNPGGPPDLNGLFPFELLAALYRLGESGIAGLDYAEVYPLQDPQSFSSHLAAWAIIYALAGLACRKRG